MAIFAGPHTLQARSAGMNRLRCPTTGRETRLDEVPAFCPFCGTLTGWS